MSGQPPKVMTSRQAMQGGDVRVVSQPSVEDNPLLTQTISDTSNTVPSSPEKPKSEVGEVGHKINLDEINDQETKETSTQTETKEDTHKREVASNVRSGKVEIRDLSARDLDDFMAESIIARPLQLPTFLDVRSKDPNYRLRWINFKAMGGARFDWACAAGFTKAEIKDVVGLNSNILVHPDGIKYHDVILMKIETATLFGAYKHNALRSHQMTTRFGAHKIAKQEGDAELRNGISSEGFNPNDPRVSGKIGIYIPDDKTIDALTK